MTLKDVRNFGQPFILMSDVRNFDGQGYLDQYMKINDSGHVIGASHKWETDGTYVWPVVNIRTGQLSIMSGETEIVTCGE